MESTTITFAQRQAIIDNFQLEIAERARKLRSQYNLQAQGLRARLEMRVNRIPQTMRNRNIAELMEEHENNSKPAPPPPMAMPVASERTLPAPSPIRSRPVQAMKRKSDAISTLSSEGDDKENNEELPNPKKRTKPTPTPTPTPTTTATNTTTTANSKVTRTLNPAGRKAAVPGTTNPAGVLSPRSNNSRTLPQPPAPFKQSNLSPEKKTSTLQRSGATSRAGAVSRAGNTIPRAGATSRPGTAGRTESTISRPGTASRTDNSSRPGARTVAKANVASSDSGRNSDVSAGSNGTTIVKGKKVAAKKTTTTTTTTSTVASKQAAARAVAARKAMANSTAAVGRTLRKRN